MHAVSNQWGKIRAEWFMTIGYIGPRNIPMNAIAMAPPTSEGTNQTTNSSLKRWIVRLIPWKD